MAKKILEEKNDSLTDSIFGKLIKSHNSTSPNSATLGSEMESEIKIRISTGSMLLDTILSNQKDGGLPCGRIIEIFGQESIGKSTLAYSAMRRTQEMGGVVIYADVEHAGNKKYMEMFGIDLTKIIWTDEIVLEKLFQTLEDDLVLISKESSLKNKPVLIVIDSVTSLESESENENGYDANMNVAMSKAKQLGKALRKINYFLTKANACLFCVSQIRDNVTGYGEKYVVPGGRSLPFYASIRIYLKGKEKIVSRDQQIEKQYNEALETWKSLGGKKSGIEKPEKPKMDEVTIGYKVTAFTKKNKTAPPDRECEFQIIFNKGLLDEPCYLDLLIKYGFIKETKVGFFEFVGLNDEEKTKYNVESSFRRSQWMNKISNTELLNLIKEYILNKMVIELKSKDDSIEENIVSKKLDKDGEVLEEDDYDV